MLFFCVAKVSIFFKYCSVHRNFGFFIDKWLWNRLPIAPMGTASFCGGVRRKKYSRQREKAPENFNKILALTTCHLFWFCTIFAN